MRLFKIYGKRCKPFFTFMLSLLTLSTSAFDKPASGLFFCSSL